jgi:hypothetical protein
MAKKRQLHPKTPANASLLTAVDVTATGSEQEHELDNDNSSTDTPLQALKARLKAQFSSNDENKDDNNVDDTYNSQLTPAGTFVFCLHL